LPDGDFDPEVAPYFVNRTRVIPSPKPGMSLWREQLYMVMRRNATGAADFFSLPPNRVFEIGTTIEL
jgi:KUP system potassium uptake protein